MNLVHRERVFYFCHRVRQSNTRVFGIENNFNNLRPNRTAKPIVRPKGDKNSLGRSKEKLSSFAARGVGERNVVGSKLFRLLDFSFLFLYSVFGNLHAGRGLKGLRFNVSLVFSERALGATV